MILKKNSLKINSLNIHDDGDKHFGDTQGSGLTVNLCDP